MGATVASDSRMATPSIGPGAGSFDSGTSTGVRISSGSSTGTATRKTDPHQKCSSSTPPTSGPSADPPEKPDAQIAIARRRCFRSVKIERRSDSVDGMSIAPKKPRAARAAMSCEASVAKAARAETTPKPAAPIMSSRRRP